MSVFKKKKVLIPDTLMLEIADTQRALDTAYSVFENVLDHDLIDSSIYNINAMQEKYKFLLKKAKEAEQSQATG